MAEANKSKKTPAKTSETPKKEENFPQVNSEAALKNRFASVKTMFEDFNHERRMVYSDAEGSEYGTGDPAIHGTFFIFMTIPDLNISEAEKTNRGFLGIGNPFARYILAEQLYKKGKLSNNFIKLFTNTALNAPFQDINLDSSEIAENWDGVKLTVAKDSIASVQGGTVNLRFRELDGNPVLNTINIWHNYITAVTKGIISPTKENLDNRVLDYAATLYVFSLAPDNTTIEYAAKYTGVYPAAVPAAAGSNDIGSDHGTVELDVPFTFNFYEAMNGTILEDFNRSAKYIEMGKPDLSMSIATGHRGELIGNHAYLRFKGSIPYVSVNSDPSKDPKPGGKGKNSKR